MIECNNCGKTVNETMKFCTGCGNPLRSQTTVKNISKTKATPETQEIRKPRSEPRVMQTSKTKREQSKLTSGLGLSYYLILLGLVLVIIDFDLIPLGLTLAVIGGIILVLSGENLIYESTQRPVSLLTLLVFPFTLFFVFGRFTFGSFIANLVIIGVSYYLSPPSILVLQSESNQPSNPVRVDSSPLILGIGSFFSATIAIENAEWGLIWYSLSVAYHVSKLNKVASDISKGTSETPETKRTQRVAQYSARAQIESLPPLILNQVELFDTSRIRLGLSEIRHRLKEEEGRLNKTFNHIKDFHSSNQEGLLSREEFIKETTVEDLETRIGTLRAIKQQLLKFNIRVEEISSAINYLEETYIPYISEQILPTFNPEIPEIISFQNTISEVEARLGEIGFESMVNRSNQMIVSIGNFETEYTEIMQRKELEAIQVIEEQYETQSFKFKSIVSERRLSNLFAYVGVLFIVFGIFAALNFIYLTYILPQFPEEAPQSTAIQGIVIVYILGLLIGFVTPRILNLFLNIPKWTSNLFYSIGFITIQTALFLQKFYFVNAGTSDEAFLFLGLAVALLMGGLAYKLNSNLIALTLAEFGFLFIFQSGVSEVGSDYSLTLFSLILMGILFTLTLNKGLWVPYWGFGILALPAWLVIQSNTGYIFLPEILALLLSVSNVYLSLSDRLKVEKTFGHFGVTVFLILPNIFTINFAIINVENELMEPLRQFLIIFVFSAFFFLYWIFLVYEGELNLSIKVPVSYKFSEEQIKMKSINQTLNWMMLSSIAILITAAIYLAGSEVYGPILYFALVMACASIFAIRKNFEGLVESSTFMFILSAELFFIMAEFNVALNIWTMIPYGLFLAIFAYLFYELVKTGSRDFKLILTKRTTTALIAFVSILNFYNFASASLSDFMFLVQIYAVIIWILLSEMISKLKEQKIDSLMVYQMPVIIPLMSLLVVGILKSGTPFNAKTSSDHILINLPLILFIIYSYYLVSVKSLQLLRSETLSVPQSRKYLIHGRLYYPQIILFILPTIILIYGEPYFYSPVENQMLLFAYVLVYFISLPLLIIISNGKGNYNFTINSGLIAFYSLLLSFTFLGGAKRVYNSITNPNQESDPNSSLIPIELATFIFVLIFALSAFSIMLLSRKKLEYGINPIENTSEVTS